MKSLLRRVSRSRQKLKMPKTNTKTPPQTTTLTTNSRSKISLNKRRPLSRNNTQLTLTKTTATNNYHHHKNTKNKKKGAFKGALDPDPEDEQHEQQTQKKDDQVWVSEPSTRCTTPNQQQNQLENTPIKLELQLPNPLPLPPLSHHQQKSPSPPPHQPTITPSSLLSSSTSSTSSSSSSSSSSINEESLPDPPETRGRSKSRHRTNEPTIEPVPRPRQVSLSQPAASTPPAIPNSSEQLSQTTTPSPTMLPNKGKAKASPGSSKPPRGNRSSVNSVRSLSSLVILHNDAHLKAPNTTRLALKRVDSAASIVLPPKIDTTEAVITLNGKAAFNPTLMSISDFPSEISPASPLPNTPTSSPVATTSKTCTMSNSPPSFQPDELSRLPQPPSPTSVNLEQSECALRLKKYSNATRPRHLVNVRAANEPPSGLISSLLSPGLTFKSRRSDPHPGAGYFDSFKSLVGISSLAEQVTEEEGHSKAEPDRSSTLASRSSPRPVHALTGTLSQSKRDATPGVSLNGVRYPFVQSQKLLGHARPAQPKPAIPGMMTTCGPLPVQSKFLGPRPAPPATSPQPEPSASSRSSQSRPSVVNCTAPKAAGPSAGSRKSC
ncbi:uncharacterized protein VP01_4242g1 [Puccinia sorghi]|uniref:Uncharacterized protein n=1 Tax=Puccinia sorghi TaxID=27349 RepID=A0A0L6UQG5_9BASI|nr:uncharacterized protein VP01_4242g1 [Puccinia sorghi]